MQLGDSVPNTKSAQTYFHFAWSVNIGYISEVFYKLIQPLHVYIFPAFFRLYHWLYAQ